MNDYAVFDLFLDLPHPAASQGRDGTKVIAPPTSVNTSSEAIAQELYESQNISRITRFAFPEHDDQLHGANMTYGRAVREAMKDPSANAKNQVVSSGAGLNKLDVYFYSFKQKYHTFTLQLGNGVRVHGHVRRYLPTHREAISRYDVGRRGCRAMVLLTRAPGGGRFYLSILKTLEAITSLNLGTHKDIHSWKNPRQAFLFAMQKKQAQIVNNYKLCELQLKVDNRTYNNDHPMLKMESPSEFAYHIDVTDIVIHGSEFGPKSPVVNLDSLRFHLPAVLQPGFTGKFTATEIDGAMLPLLRVLGPTHTIRLLSALMCERRVILVSKSAALLSACVSATASILAQGLLVWQHVFVSVLPPHLLKYLASETPYVIGLLDGHAVKLDILPGISDVLSINLDTNSLQTYRMSNPATCVPDLLLPMKRKKGDTTVTCAELLAQDLREVISADERFWAEARGTKTEAKEVEEEVARARTKKKSFAPRFSRKSQVDKSRKAAAEEDSAAMLGMMMRSANKNGVGRDQDGDFMDDFDEEEDMQSIAFTENESEDTKKGENECFENETAEEGARVAFVTFFLYLYGDMGMALSERDGKLILDRRKFMACKRMSGITEDSPLYFVLGQFSRTTMFRRFVKCRIQELELTPEDRRKCLDHHMSLFSACETHMRQKQVKWTLTTIRPVIQKFAYASAKRKMSLWGDGVRKKTLALTANQEFSGNALKSLAELIDQCCEVNGSLSNIMGAVWTRLQDGRSTMWRHPLLGLYVLRNIVMHGPLTAVAEASDGITRIRALRSYDCAKNKDGARDVRDTATEVYELLVDRTRLFAERRSLSCRRLKLDAPKKSSRWEDYLVRRLPVLVAFNHIHGLLRPKGKSDRKNNRKSVDYTNRRRSSTGTNGNGVHDSVTGSTAASSKAKPKQPNGNGKARKPSADINKLPEDKPDIQNLVNLFNSSMDAAPQVPPNPSQEENEEVDEEKKGPSYPPQQIRTTPGYSVASSIDSSIMQDAIPGGKKRKGWRKKMSR